MSLCLFIMRTNEFLYQYQCILHALSMHAHIGNWIFVEGVGGGGGRGPRQPPGNPLTLCMCVCVRLGAGFWIINEGVILPLLPPLSLALSLCVCVRVHAHNIIICYLPRKCLVRPYTNVYECSKYNYNNNWIRFIDYLYRATTQHAQWQQQQQQREPKQRRQKQYSWINPFTKGSWERERVK